MKSRVKVAIERLLEHLVEYVKRRWARIRRNWARRKKVLQARVDRQGLRQVALGRFSRPPIEDKIGPMIGGGTLPVAHEFPAPGATAEDLAWDGLHLWVCDWGASEIYQIDPVTGTIQRAIATAVAMEAITWNGRAVCGASIAGADAIYSIDPTDGTLTRLMAAPGTDGGTRGLCWDGRHFWTNNMIDQITYQIDAQGVILRSFATPWLNPGGMTWAGGYIWTCDLAGLFFRIDPLSGVVTDYILSPGNAPTGLTWDGEALWSVDEGTHMIYKTRVS